MDFKDLLTKQGFDLDKVMVLRHRPTEPALRKVLPWLAAERPQVFNAYQKAQNPDAEKALLKADIAASFIAQEDEKALFVGLYRRTGSHPITEEQYWAIPENAEMKPFGLGGIKNRETGTTSFLIPGQMRVSRYVSCDFRLSPLRCVL
jgi:tRNA A37 threonylcarbamoyladenosine modification protein TsaB